MAHLRKLLFGLALSFITVMGVGSAEAQVSGCPIGSTSILGCYRVDGTTITVNGGVISAIGGAATSIVVGTTTVGAGTTGRVLYDNAGVLGEYSISGTGNVAMTASPTFTGTVNAAALILSGNLTTNITGGGTQCVTVNNVGVLAGVGVTCGTASITVGSTPISGGTTTKVLFDNAGTLGEYTISGTGNVAMTISPVFTTPNIGTATGHATLDLPLTGGTLTGTLTMSGANIALGTNSLTGNFTITGAPILTGISTGTIAAGGNLGLDASNNLVKATVSGGSGLTVGTTTITSGTNAFVLYNNSGVLGNESFASACTAATGAALGCVQVDTSTITVSAGVITGIGDAVYVSNAGSTGTTVNKLAKLTGAPSTAVITATTDPPNATAIGVVTAGAGTSGTAVIQYSGVATCAFDGATTAGHAVGMSTTTSGDCHDLGAAPGQGQIVGTVLGTIGGAGNAPVLFNIPTTTALPSPGNNQIIASNASAVAAWGTALPNGITATTQALGDAGTSVATDAFVAAAISGVNPATSVSAATTAAGDTSSYVYANGVSGVGATLTGPTNNVAVTIDGFTFTAIGQRLLVKNDTQSPSGAFNGVYSLTILQGVANKPVLTRSLDYDQPSDINSTGTIPVINGTANANTSWILTTNVTTIGTDPLTYAQFSYAPSSIALLGANQAFTKGQAGTPVALTDASTIAVDASTGNNFTVTLGGSRTLGNPTNLKAGQVLNFWFTQDGSGSRVLTYSSDYQAAGSVSTLVLSTAAGAVDLVSCISNTTSTLTCALSKAVAH